MKTTISLIAGLALTVSAIALSGQTGAALPTLAPGQGRFLTSEQRVARQQQMQTTVANLRAKKAAGTLTAEEQAWLDQAEQRGGWCINGTPARLGQQMTPEQRTACQQQMQKYMTDLRAKKAADTITPDEQAWLDQAEKQGGWCVNGIPCGRGWGAQGGAGFGPGCGRGWGAQAGNGFGHGRGRGWGRGANGCPFATPPSPVPGN
jgi:hypothetical protein